MIVGATGTGAPFLASATAVEKEKPQKLQDRFSLFATGVFA